MNNDVNTPQIENGYVRIATELLEGLLTVRLTGNEWNILLAVVRETYGWNKKSSAISLSTFTKLTKLPRPTVSKNIKRLVARQLLVATQLPAGNFYQIQKDHAKWVTSSRHDTSSNLATRVVAPLLPAVVAPLLPPYKVLKTIKDNNLKTLKKNKQKKVSLSLYELNDFHFQSVAEKYNVPIGFVISTYEDMVNWHESTGKQKKDWLATLRVWVKKDAFKIRKEQHDRSKIAVIEL